jgi:hypothetical protein
MVDASGAVASFDDVTGRIRTLEAHQVIAADILGRDDRLRHQVIRRQQAQTYEVLQSVAAGQHDCTSSRKCRAFDLK